MKSSRTGRGQLFEAEVEAEEKSSRLRTKFWPRGQLGLEELTSLGGTIGKFKLLKVGKAYYPTVITRTP